MLSGVGVTQVVAPVTLEGFQISFRNHGGSILENVNKREYLRWQYWVSERIPWSTGPCNLPWGLLAVLEMYARGALTHIEGIICYSFYMHNWVKFPYLWRRSSGRPVQCCILWQRGEVRRGCLCNCLAIMQTRIYWDLAWWRHQMETFSVLLALCAGNSPVTGEFPSQRPVTRIFYVFFHLCLNKRLSKQSWGWRFETPSRPLWCHCNGEIWYCLIYGQ